MPGYFPNMESLVNIERIDVLKGPAGNLFGSPQAIGSFANLGGTIAITSSEPGRAPVRQVGLRVGSYGERGVTFDFSQPLGSDFGLRLAGEVGRSDSETDRACSSARRRCFRAFRGRRIAIPKWYYGCGYLDNTTLDYSGLPPAGTGACGGLHHTA